MASRPQKRQCRVDSHPPEMLRGCVSPVHSAGRHVLCARGDPRQHPLFWPMHCCQRRSPVVVPQDSSITRLLHEQPLTHAQWLHSSGLSYAPRSGWVPANRPRRRGLRPVLLILAYSLNGWKAKRLETGLPTVTLRSFNRQGYTAQNYTVQDYSRPGTLKWTSECCDSPWMALIASSAACFTMKSPCCAIR